MALNGVRFTPKGANTEKEFFLITNEKDEKVLRASDESMDIPLQLDNGMYIFINNNLVSEDDDVIRERMLGLSQELMESRESGFEEESDSEDNLTLRNYGPDDIFVENKPFSLKQLMDLVDGGDIELSPTFQRNFIWDKTRQSRLIESILLGLPLPSLYLSQYNDGRLTIVDGVQRISTIRNFLQDKLVLSNLEYLTNCNGKKWSQMSQVLSQLQLRRFGQTQILCFVIDYRSPQRLKYDLFRRLNTGGKPLNNQEIRNCLSRVHVQTVLHKMAHSKAFINATGRSVRDLRMEASEAALRFIYFYDQYSISSPTGLYNGNMEDTLDSIVEELNMRSDLEKYVSIYTQSLEMAYQLFGDQAFRKVFPSGQRTRKSQVNKLLLLAETVLLAKNADNYKTDRIEGISLVQPMIDLIDSDRDFFNAITWSTNSKANIDFAMCVLKEKLFDKYLL